MSYVVIQSNLKCTGASLKAVSFLNQDKINIFSYNLKLHIICLENFQSIAMMEFIFIFESLKT